MVNIENAGFNASSYIRKRRREIEIEDGRTLVVQPLLLGQIANLESYRDQPGELGARFIAEAIHEPSVEPEEYQAFSLPIRERLAEAVANVNNVADHYMNSRLSTPEERLHDAMITMLEVRFRPVADAVVSTPHQAASAASVASAVAVSSLATANKIGQELSAALAPITGAKLGLESQFLQVQSLMRPQPTLFQLSQGASQTRLADLIPSLAIASDIGKAIGKIQINYQLGQLSQLQIGKVLSSLQAVSDAAIFTGRYGLTSRAIEGAIEGREIDLQPLAPQPVPPWPPFTPPSRADQERANQAERNRILFRLANGDMADDHHRWKLAQTPGQIREALEIGLRNLISIELERKYGAEDWWDKGVPRNIRLDAEKRFDGDDKVALFVKRQGPVLIRYTDFAHLSSIIEYGKNWEPIFRPIFGDKHNIKWLILGFNDVRASDAHSRPLTPAEYARMFAFGQMLAIFVEKHRRKQATYQA